VAAFEILDKNTNRAKDVKITVSEDKKILTIWLDGKYIMDLELEDQTPSVYPFLGNVIDCRGV
jgi:hypothetical protein